MKIQRHTNRSTKTIIDRQITSIDDCIGGARAILRGEDGQQHEVWFQEKDIHGLKQAVAHLERLIELVEGAEA